MSTLDILGLPSQEPHRVVSFPASQYLHVSTTPASISTGLPQLDEAIYPSSSDEPPASTNEPSPKGIRCGHVTEVFGPPGVGKTSLALSIASNALRAGGKVVWIDTASPLPRLRLGKMLLKHSASNKDNPSEQSKDLVDNLLYFRAKSLPHLLALLLHPPKGFPPEETNLLVVDAVSGPFPSYFPNPSELRSRLAQSKITDKSQIMWLMNRKWNVLSELASRLMKLATTHRLAVLLINETHTKIKGLPRATLTPILAGGSWENSIYTRIVLYRDFPEDMADDDKVRFAEVLKREGKGLTLRLEENIIPFMIESDCLRGTDKKRQPPSAFAQEQLDEPFPSKQRKRKVEEIADSQDEEDIDDEDFGWIESDDAGLLEEDGAENP